MDEIKRKTVKFPVIFSPIRLATTVLNFLWEPFTSGRSTDRKKSLISFLVGIAVLIRPVTVEMMICIFHLSLISITTWWALAAFQYLKLI